MDREEVGPSWGQWVTGTGMHLEGSLVPFQSLSSSLLLPSCHEVGKQLYPLLGWCASPKEQQGQVSTH